MKTPNILSILALLFIITPVFLSCNKDNIEELEKRIAELEKLTSEEDSVIFSDLIISNQESMNIMADRGIKHILGVLSISNCTDLTPLTGLMSVGGLQLEAPTGLSSLAGLEGIKGLDMLSVYFENNSINLDALNNLEAVNSLYLAGNVPSAINFPNISSLGYFYLDGNSNSITISGFDNITSIDYLFINNHSGSLRVDGFENLSTIMELSLGAETINLSGFNAITSIDYLNIYANELNCSGLNGIKSLEQLYLYGYNLDISGFNGLTSLGGMGFSGSTLDVTGFKNLSSLGYLDVTMEHGINGLNNLKTISYLNLNIGNSDNFLLGLTSVDHLSLYSYYNRSNPIVTLADLGLTSLQTIESINIELPDLESLDGLDFANENLKRFAIYNCPKLDNITKLSSITSSLTSLSIYGSVLTSLEGLENVTGISELTVVDNSQLGNWCAIKGIFDDIPINQRYISTNLLNPTSSADITGCN